MKTALDVLVTGLAWLAILVIYAVYCSVAVCVVIGIIRIGQFMWRITA